MKAMSKIVRFHELGDADVLNIEPELYEVYIDVEAIGLNRAEGVAHRRTLANH